MADPTYVDDFTRGFVLTRSRPWSWWTSSTRVAPRAWPRRLLGSQGRLADAEYRFIRIDRLVVPNSRRSPTPFRAAGAQVIFVAYGSRLADFSDAPLRLKRSDAGHRRSRRHARAPKSSTN